MTSFIDNLRRINPRIKIILTVSPVPLVATAQTNAHVLAATTYSKSVLRVAAEMLTTARPNISYFPAYEIIMSRAFDPGTYFAPDRRDILGPGVAHVMRAFAETYVGVTAPAPAAPPPPSGDAHTQNMQALMQVHCDEAALDPG
jgi:hypothetical protein